MPLIQWSEHLCIGIDSIDQQHKLLVNILNELNDAIIDGKAHLAMEKTFDGLAVYTIKHFTYEEELFAKHGYSGEQAHKREHQELIHQVQDLKQKMENGDFMINTEVMNFLKDWLTHHILKTDKAFVPFLIEKGVT
jgi:hemerythrin